MRIEDNLRQARCRPRTASWGDAEAARTRRADARRASRGATRALSSALRMARSYRTGLNRLAPSDDESESDSSDGELFEDEARSAFAAALWDL